MSNLYYQADSEVVIKTEWLKHRSKPDHPSDLGPLPQVSAVSEMGKCTFGGGNQLSWEVGRMRGTSWNNLVVKLRVSWNSVLWTRLAEKSQPLCQNADLADGPNEMDLTNVCMFQGSMLKALRVQCWLSKLCLFGSRALRSFCLLFRQSHSSYRDLIDHEHDLLAHTGDGLLQ